MKYQPNQIYHIFNQGNNRQKIFFKEDNYLYFKLKIQKYISPISSILAYCLMPNHFHLLVYTSALSTEVYKNSGKQNLSFAISKLLSSYTKAINNQEKRSGSLFRSKTKSVDGWDMNNDYRSAEQFEGEILTFIDNKYVQIVFEYIHNNPVKSKLVNAQRDWKYSSVNEYFEKENFQICDVKLGKKLLGLTFA